MTDNHETTHAERLVAHLRHVAEGPGGMYRTHLLHALALALADETGAWRPASKIELRRLLATKDQGTASVAEVELALRQARSQRLIEPESDWGALALTGMEASL